MSQPDRPRQSRLDADKYRFLVENISEMIFLLEIDGTLSYVNPGSRRIVGIEAGKLIGLPLSPLVHPDDLNEVLLQMHDSIDHGEPVEIEEVRLQHVDGRWIHVAISLAPFRDESGDVNQLMGILYDITRHKQVEEQMRRQSDDLSAVVEDTSRELARSERFLRNTMEFLKRQNRMLEAMHRFSKQWGLQTPVRRIVFQFVEILRDSFPPIHFAIRLAGGPDGPYRTVAAHDFGEEREGMVRTSLPLPVSLALRERTSLVFESPEQLQDAQYEPCEEGIGSVLIVPMVAMETPIGVIQFESHRRGFFVREERDQLEMFAAQLAVSIHNRWLYETSTALREYYETIVDGITLSLFLLDEAFQVRFINRAAERFLGADREDCVGRHVLDVLDQRGEDKPLEKALAECRAGTPVSGLEIQLRGGDSHIHPVLLNLNSIEYSGEGREILMTFLDVTERKNLEQQMLHSEKLASLGQMAASIAHELNNPLTFISSHAQLLLAQGSDEGTETRIQKINDAAERIQELVRNLLSYARPSDDAMAFPLDLNLIIKELFTFMEYQFRKVGIQPVLELAEGLPKVAGKKGELQQVFVNLFENALHAMKDRNGEIFVRTRAVDEGYLAVEVEDQGHGIASKDLSHIFTPFYTTKPVGEGTGLGLSNVYNIVNRHNGRILVQSKEGQGTKFTVILPMAADQRRGEE